MKALLTAVAAAVGLIVVTGGGPTQAQQPDVLTDGAMVSLVHGIPDTVVDLQIGESIVVNGFRPGSIADISAFVGRTLEDVSLVDDESGATLLGPLPELEIPLTGNWSFVAHQDADGDLVITPFENDISMTSSGDARLTFRHTAAAPPVDLIVGDQRPVTNAANGDSASIELPDGTVMNAQIATAGGAPAVTIADLELAGETNTIIYAIGSLADDDLDFVVQTLPLIGSTPTTTSASPTTAPPTTQPTTTTPASTPTETTDVGSAGPTTVAPPTEVATGSPIESSGHTLLLVTVVGLLTTGGALAGLRRI